MITLYNIKPYFQNLLRPLVRKLDARKITANQITLAAWGGSVFVGSLLMIFPRPMLFLLLPLFLFIRMALNAIDGMLAREYDQKTNLGALLNELCDVASDLFLYLPFLFLSTGTPTVLMILTLFAICMTEFCGVLVQTLGASRRYDGPLGKSDRAFVFGTYALLFALWPSMLTYLIPLICAVLLLSLFTSYQRCRKGLQEVASAKN